ncbi:hypothetical protein HDU76_001990, partial [Blyttiomyces sp. JEL0837]
MEDTASTSSAFNFDFSVAVSDSLALDAAVQKPLDGRLMLLVSKDFSAEPRFQIGLQKKDKTGNIVYHDSQQVFGKDVEDWTGDEVHFTTTDTQIKGWPLKKLSDIPDGTYQIQAFLNIYKTYHRADGHTVKLHPDMNEGQHWFFSPGNLYSVPEKIVVEGGRVVQGSVDILLDKVVGEAPKVEEETDYIKRVTIRSERLSKFWNTDIYISAMVLLPQGFWEPEHKDAQYPLVVYQGHFSPYWSTPVRFRDHPADPDCSDYACIEQNYAYYFYKNWTATDPKSGSPYVGNRVITMTIQHANFYYDDSYAVNSANLGPYGDAIQYELIPLVEKTYRGIGAGWARTLYGGSTGGWESVGVLVKYPDEYAGSWASCPDPIDFRAYVTTNIYEDTNAYYYDSTFRKTPRPEERNRLGHLFATMEEANHYELALGTNSRSGDQFDIWQA